MYLEVLDQATNVLLDAPTRSVRDRRLGRYKPGSKLDFESRLPWKDVEVDLATKVAEKSPILYFRLWGMYVEDRVQWMSKAKCGRQLRRYMNSSLWRWSCWVDYVISAASLLASLPHQSIRATCQRCQRIHWCATQTAISCNNVRSVQFKLVRCLFCGPLQVIISLYHLCIELEAVLLRLYITSHFTSVFFDCHSSCQCIVLPESLSLSYMTELRRLKARIQERDLSLFPSWIQAPILISDID